MPKKLIQEIPLPMNKPDCCFRCPLIGKIPEHIQRPKNNREGFVCLGTMEALTSKGIKVEASTKDKKHPWHRPCDDKWELWYNANNRHTFGIGNIAYNECRLPFMRYYQQQTQLIIKFH